MICPKCGKDNPAGCSFCMLCGAALSEVSGSNGFADILSVGAEGGAAAAPDKKQEQDAARQEAKYQSLQDGQNRLSTQIKTLKTQQKLFPAAAGLLLLLTAVAVFLSASALRKSGEARKMESDNQAAESAFSESIKRSEAAIDALSKSEEENRKALSNLEKEMKELKEKADELENKLQSAQPEANPDSTRVASDIDALSKSEEENRKALSNLEKEMKELKEKADEIENKLQSAQLEVKQADTVSNP